MSSTASNTSSRELAKGARGAPARASSSTVHSSIAHIATICCASTSSGLRGYAGRARSAPSSMPLARRPPPRAGRRGTSGRCGPGSARRPGGRRGRSRWRPARDRRRATRPGRRGRPRPCRCRARASEVATSAAQPPRLELVLDLAAAARARASRGARGRAPRPASSFRRLRASRSAEPARVHEHDRRAVLPDQLEQARVDGRPDARAAAGAAARRPRRCRPARPCRRPAPRPRGRAACARRRRRWLDRSRLVPPRKRAISSAAAAWPTGRCAAAAARVQRVEALER